jgi:hypothetical protein
MKHRVVRTQRGRMTRISSPVVTIQDIASVIIRTNL